MEQWRIAMFGDLAGKTSLAVRYTLDSFIGRYEYDPTIEDAYRRSVVIDDKMTFLEIVDTAGPEEYAPLCDQWVRESEGFILVYSITSKHSYERMKTFQDILVRLKGETRPTYMLVGNKSDREWEREVSRAEAQELSQQWGCPWMEAITTRRQ
ncbi:hypothetical protein BDV93DRAFT_229187 [Ceratobasidium sp. AG-I]|nr:hypothetical protein BDV93DRAFT_229187 [Ceratobasidium sp. AG-I]